MGSLAIGVYIALGIITIGGTTIKWLYKLATEDEKKKQAKLKQKIANYQVKISELQDEYQKSRQHLYSSLFKELSELLLLEVRNQRRNKEKIEEDLNKLKNQINEIIRKPNTSYFMVNALKKELVSIEDGLYRLYAYYRYLNWYESMIENIKKNGKYEYLINIEPPSLTLPEDWLYVGQLFLLDNKDELFNFKNRYGQKLFLSGFYNRDSGKYDDSLEQEALARYEKDIPILIVSEPKLSFQSQEKNTRVYYGSILKGEIYYYHILRNLPIPVKPLDEKIFKIENDYYYKGIIKCKMNKYNKKFPLKKYPDDYEFFGNILEYDLLLNKIVISEKEIDFDKYTDLPVYIASDKMELLDLVNSGMQSYDSNLKAKGYDAEYGIIFFRLGNLTIECSIKKGYLFIENIKEELLTNITLFDLPFNFYFIPLEVIKKEKDLLLEADVNVLKLLNFVTSEISYFTEISKKEKDEIDFIGRWVSIIDKQIKLEEFQYYEFRYEKIEEIDFDKKIIVFKILKKELISDDFCQRLKSFTTKQNVKVAIEFRISKQDKFSKNIIGSLEDFDFTHYKVIAKLDNYIDISQIELSEFNKLYIAFYNNVSHLINQKKALLNLQTGLMVNQELKKILLFPYLASDFQSDKNFKKDIQWKNPNLTENQKQIIIKALEAKDLFLIQGPPGTGKTTVIKEIIYQFLKANPDKKCLIVSQQNVAVDNAIDRIYKENYEDWFLNSKFTMVRMASREDKIDKSVVKLSINKWFEDYKLKLLSLQNKFKDNSKLMNLWNNWYNIINLKNFYELDDEISEAFLSQFNIIGATCVGFANRKIKIDRLEFDLLIIDEAARATPPELIIPMLRAKKVILIGDHYQLPPVIAKNMVDEIENMDKLEREEFEKSFFERLYENVPENMKDILIEQFRMSPKISKLVSGFFYDGKLRDGKKELTNGNLFEKEIYWIDVKGQGIKEKDSKSIYNREEIQSIKKLLDEIEEKTDKTISVAIITPYSAQKRIIKDLIHNLRKHNNRIYCNLHIKCDTVDGFQGQEADIVIYSIAKTSGKIDFIVDRKRLNVAISRAKNHLFFVGDKNFLYNAECDENENLYRGIIDYIESN